MFPLAVLPSLLRRVPCKDQALGWSVQGFHQLQGKAFLRAWVSSRLGPSLSHILQPGISLEREKRGVWTPSGGLRAGKSDPSSTQVAVQRKQKGGATLSAAQKVKEAGRDFTYLIVVVVGIGVTGGLFYVIFKELFSSSSPSKIYGDALEKCRAHPEVIGVFGEPIKGYGEATRRGRRQLVSHIEYVKDGLKYMRLKFYIEGSEKGKQGTVHLEVKEVQQLL
ncbi:mitochondrial import inner membrane translocase subunit Tim21 isoform X2 [Sceloporus undulatus]|uniref:mitochondrial import inner membrane translocase subunit Tim21 isoform X2 n=1 Tax=Sceloporus undulatus TaxID=8520 RepID=UPI001C4AF156|nr:mitochondrial import inner membrane translocase subunit Tim21 isoform X2 [Sceloporus undulatus]